MKVKTPEKNYDIACGFLARFNWCDKIGIEIVEEGKEGDFDMDDK